MSRFARYFLAVAALSLVTPACGVDGDSSLDVIDPSPEAAERTPYELDTLFAQASAEHNVPESLLKAISYAETRWEMISGHEELPGMAPAHGLMALRGQALTDGAALAGVSPDDASTQPLANIRAAAALLSAYATELGIDRGDLSAWAPAAARLSGIIDENAQAEYIHDEIYGIMQRGAVARTPEGTIAVTLEPMDVEPAFPAPMIAKAAGPDYPSSVWRPSPNYNARPSGSTGGTQMVVIHTCEGSYAGCWGWLTNSASGVSAHYVVKEDGSEISQLVREVDRAWHVGATYSCSLNGNVKCNLNGYSVNNFSIGIEHAGYASQSSFPAGQIDASARLVCDITRDRSIPRDSYHIVAHGRLQPYNRTDPGPNWPWTNYLNLINSYCGSGSSSIIIDNNNANNDTSKGYIQFSSNWTGSSNVAGYYGSGYHWASTQAISDVASFWFYLPTAGTKTIDAWWTSASDRSTSAPFIAYNASGTQLGTVHVNQQANGGKWNTLGTWSFQAGWNRIALSRWTTTGYVVIADAVRVR